MTTHRAIVAGLFVGACVSAPTGARAEDFGNLNLAVHGFASQGYLQSSDNNFASLNTKEGTFAFTDEALNITAQPLPGLRVGAQLFARDFGPQGNHKVVMDWALGDYRVADWFGVRAGKVKQPLGLYNTVVDADMARAEILQPAGAYPVSNRELTNTFNGVDVYGTLTIGPAGSLDYEAWVGTIDLDDAYIVSRFAKEGAASGLNAFRPLRLTNLDYQVDSVTASMDHLYGGALEWRPPVAGLRLRSTAITAESDFAVATTYTGFQGQNPLAIATRTNTDFKQKYVLYLSGEYQRGGLRVSAEHVRAHNQQRGRISGLPFPVPEIAADQKPASTYGQVTYRFTERLQGSTYYSVSYSDRDDKEGLKQVAAGRPDYNGWSKDFAVTGRVDINAHWLLKLEMHFLDGTAGLSSVENPTGLVKDWRMFAAKTTFHF